MFSDKEKEVLQKYVTSADANIFAIHGMEGMVGAAYARYSRAKGGFREVLLKEFIQEGNIDPKHADELIERVLVAYGDDSVGELEGAHVSFEKITMLAAKEIEDRRIGGSPIEQSTRYVLYDQKNEDGNWLYYRGDEVLHAPYGKQYTETMDLIFQTYADLIEPLRTHLETQKPLSEAEYDINGDGVKEKLADLTDEKHIKGFKQTYTFELRAKACDILRALLPVATLTNVGMFGNGRFFQNLISYLITSDIPENHTIAKGVQDALKPLLPQYIRRARRSEYNAGIHKKMYTLAKELLDHVKPEKPAELPEFTLMDRGEELLEKRIRHEGSPALGALQEVSDIHLLAAMLYPYADLPLHQIRKAVEHMDKEKRERIVAGYISSRESRRDRPGRALEDGYPYTFDMVTNFGVYKDLQRHRMNTQTRQLFTTKLGFIQDVPELIAIGAQDKISKCVQEADRLYDAMAKENPLLAQYAVLHGHYIRWTMGFNDREAMHLLELRSTPQGHPNYRVAAQKMHKLIEERSSWRAGLMKFVDHNDYYWSRADSEAKQRVKEAKLDEKYGTDTQ
jgi:thymidylate synthase ThyX